MQVSVAYTEPSHQIWLSLDVPDDSTVYQAIERSGILARCPDLDLKKNKVGVFGKIIKLIVPLAVWNARHEELLARDAAVGIRLASSEHPETIADALDDVALVAIDFPARRFVVATQVGGITEQLQPEPMARLVPPEAPALAAALAALAEAAVAEMPAAAERWPGVVAALARDLAGVLR